jgi:hypothetical protein
MKNVLGDTVDIDLSNIDPNSEKFASNGKLYSYVDFKVPEYLYMEEIKIEGEHLIDSASGIWVWKPGVRVTGSEAARIVNPRKIGALGSASNDSSVLVTVPEFNFKGSYQVEFFFRNMFPMKYLFVWGGNFSPGGIYEIYVNDELIRTYDTFDLRSTVFSVKPGKYYYPTGGFNAFDAWVENITEYGNIKVTLKYINPSPFNRNSGLSLDYISFIPEK